MQNNLISKITLVLVGTAITGCAEDRVLMATKTNVGLDVDNKPPTAELTIARRELAIQPVFPEMIGKDAADRNGSKKSTAIVATETEDVKEIAEGEKLILEKGATVTVDGPATIIAEDKETALKEGETKTVQGPATVIFEGKETSLPLLASFGLQGKFYNPRITGQFAGGDAALYLAQDPSEDNEHPVDSSLCMKNPPDTRGWLLKLWHSLTNTSLEEYQLEHQKDSRIFYFATDTAYGLKVAWSGTGGPYPDSLKLGYNRKEFASPPIFVDQGCNGRQENWNVKLPSFYASIDNASALETFQNAEDKHIQFFATGKAASAFAKRASVRQVAFQNMAPDAAKSEAESLNRDLIGEIKETFKADTADKNAILAEAVKLGLVPSNTKKEEFEDKLSANATGINYSVTTKLNQLRTIAPTLTLKKVSGASET
ncbi:MAG: hypothetical protein ACR65O_01305 [Methylomicrobium sp.]